MKMLLTGLSGTLAPVVARSAAAHGIKVVGWNRSAVAPDDASASHAWLEAQRPDMIGHLAVGSVEWARLLAMYASEHSVPLLFTSTAMVFHNVPDGPHLIGDERNAQDPYGQYKRECEDAISSSCAHACIARIGWQIDPLQPGNNMLLALDQWQAKEGRVSASRAWRPACSFMEDTATALLNLLRAPVPGVTHIDSNADEGYDFASIARALKHVFERDAWTIHQTEDYVHDQRLAGGGDLVAPLSSRLQPLKHMRSGDA
jgi:dTDP-4-dehydrorhamnose reductase